MLFLLAFVVLKDFVARLGALGEDHLAFEAVLVYLLHDIVVVVLTNWRAALIAEDERGKISMVTFGCTFLAIQKLLEGGLVLADLLPCLRQVRALDTMR